MKNASENKDWLNFLALKNFLVYQVGKKSIAWLENIIARYSLVENTYFLDPINFTWTTKLEKR
jgi:phage anti-repressor protein